MNWAARDGSWSELPTSPAAPRPWLSSNGRSHRFGYHPRSASSRRDIHWPFSRRGSQSPAGYPRGRSLVTRHRVLFAAWLLCCLATAGDAFAQAQPTPQSAPVSAPAAAQPAADDPIGNVATLTGNATVTRNNASAPLKLKDDIFLNDALQTSANSTLGVTFNDSTTFNLTANARIAVDSFVYEDGGKANAALFNVAKGTVAFVAAAVAKSGDMK